MVNFNSTLSPRGSCVPTPWATHTQLGGVTMGNKETLNRMPWSTHPKYQLMQASLLYQWGNEGERKTFPEKKSGGLSTIREPSCKKWAQESFQSLSGRTGKAKGTHTEEGGHSLSKRLSLVTDRQMWLWGLALFCASCDLRQVTRKDSPNLGYMWMDTCSLLQLGTRTISDLCSSQCMRNDCCQPQFPFPFA